MTDENPSPAEHDWPVLESATEYETGWYAGGYDLVELPDGRQKRYYWAELPPAVVVVAVVEEPAPLGLPRPTGPGGSTDPVLVMVEQYRPAIGEHCLELPAGIVEDGEDYAAAGARELEEEVGIAAGEVTLLSDFWCATGVLRHERGIVWAADFEPAERTLDGSEFLDVLTVPIESALEEARTGPANDATLEGLLLARADGYL
jgi:ADP-ribose pyrophosphatase